MLPVNNLIIKFGINCQVHMLVGIGDIVLFGTSLLFNVVNYLLVPCKKDRQGTFNSLVLSILFKF